ncbi:MAG: HD domain-containing protein [Candidatus Omnitrophota bacterium]
MAINDFSMVRKVKLYLVGGFLRDRIIGRSKENPDFDFAVKKNAINFSRALAKKLKCGFVVLDKLHGSSRLVKKDKGKTYTFDFTDFRGESLQEDLKRRDFTINALAVDLKEGLVKKDFSDLLIDLHKGREDIRKKLIRMIDNNSFIDDPLRILRAFSLSALLGFSIDRKTLKSARLNLKKLILVSKERIRDELFKIFSSDRAYESLYTLDKARILEIIFPEVKRMRNIGQGPYHHLDVWQHTLETVKELEIIFKNLKDKEILRYLDTAISSERRRRSLLKFAALLHDIGKPQTMKRQKGKTTFHGHERMGLKIAEGIAKRLKLSNDEVSLLRKIVLWHLRPGYLADSSSPTPRAKFRYFRDTGEEALSTLLLSLADQRSTKGPLTTLKARKQHERVIAMLIKEYLYKDKVVKSKRLLDGYEVMKEFNLKPSFLVGELLSLLDELQGIGKVKNRAQALCALAKYIKKR